MCLILSFKDNYRLVTNFIYSVPPWNCHLHCSIWLICWKLAHKSIDFTKDLDFTLSFVFSYTQILNLFLTWLFWQRWQRKNERPMASVSLMLLQIRSYWKTGAAPYISPGHKMYTPVKISIVLGLLDGEFRFEIVRFFLCSLNDFFDCPNFWIKVNLISIYFRFPQKKMRLNMKFRRRWRRSLFISLDSLI